MSIYVNARIKIAKDGQSLQTKTGTPMSKSFGFADIGGENGFPLGVIAFGHIAEDLKRVKKGESIAVMGNLQSNSYVNKAGENVTNYQVIADALMTLKRASPLMHERKPKGYQEQGNRHRPQHGVDPDLDDDLTF